MTQVASDLSFKLSDHAFHHIAAIAASDAGLSIPTSKKALVQSRISKRMRDLGLSTVEDYLSSVNDKIDGAERRELISILTTNVSSFFREHHHFDHLIDAAFPLFEEKLKKNERVRIWSAGCSSGQEPYSLGIEMLKGLSSATGEDMLILATDIDPVVLRQAKEGTYSANDLQQVSPDDRSRFFEPSGTSFRVTKKLQNLVRFKELNLHSEWPMSGPFDAIFCRNVLIYFDEAHQRALWPRFCRMLVPGGYLYLGHSERIHPLNSSGFESRGATIYQKTSQER